MSKDRNNACPVKKTSIGGQALMEGIMMRGPKTTAMAVRNPRGEIVIETFPTVGKPRPAICRWPIIRGVVGFVDSMSFGYKCLMRSAEIAGLEEMEAELEREKAEKKAAKKAEKEAKKAKKQGISEAVSAPAETVEPAQAEAAAEPAQADEIAEPAQAAEIVEPAQAAEIAEPAQAEAAAEPADGKAKKKGSVMMDVLTVVMMILSFALVIGLFFFLPSFLYKDVLEAHVPSFPQNNRFLQSVICSVIRLTIMIGYMSLMLLMKDIRRTFQFHGAEHKTIFCYEHGLELTVENIRGERRFHPRCGTSFLIIMLLVGILIGFFIPADLNKWLLTGLKLAIMPVVMGIGYELIKICGKHDNFLTRILSAPGLWFQRITVLEPDDAMIECAIAAMKEAIPDDNSDTF